MKRLHRMIQNADSCGCALPCPVGLNAGGFLADIFKPSDISFKIPFLNNDLCDFPSNWNAFHGMRPLVSLPYSLAVAVKLSRLHFSMLQRLAPLIPVAAIVQQ